jgi:hypothetical protein
MYVIAALVPFYLLAGAAADANRKTRTDNNPWFALHRAFEPARKQDYTARGWRFVWVKRTLLLVCLSLMLWWFFDA